MSFQVQWDMSLLTTIWLWPPESEFNQFS
jgi:hypothetical protein